MGGDGTDTRLISFYLRGKDERKREEEAEVLVATALCDDLVNGLVLKSNEDTQVYLLMKKYGS